METWITSNLMLLNSAFGNLSATWKTGIIIIISCLIIQEFLLWFINYHVIILHMDWKRKRISWLVPQDRTIAVMIYPVLHAAWGTTTHPSCRFPSGQLDQSSACTSDCSVGCRETSGFSRSPSGRAGLPPTRGSTWLRALAGTPAGSYPRWCHARRRSNLREVKVKCNTTLVIVIQNKTHKITLKLDVIEEEKKLASKWIWISRWLILKKLHAPK